MEGLAHNNKIHRIWVKHTQDNKGLRDHDLNRMAVGFTTTCATFLSYLIPQALQRGVPSSASLHNGVRLVEQEAHIFAETQI